jgi:integral membrane protein
MSAVHEGQAAHEPGPTPLDFYLAVARLEGLSVLALFFVAMPLKYGAGIPEPVQWVGWTHGVFVFLYLIALGTAARTEAWTWGRTALGFVVSLLPFGTFWFERRLRA